MSSRDSSIGVPQLLGELLASVSTRRVDDPTASRVLLGDEVDDLVRGLLSGLGSDFVDEVGSVEGGGGGDAVLDLKGSLDVVSNLMIRRRGQGHDGSARIVALEFAEISVWSWKEREDGQSEKEKRSRRARTHSQVGTGETSEGRKKEMCRVSEDSRTERKDGFLHTS